MDLLQSSSWREAESTQFLVMWLIKFQYRREHIHRPTHTYTVSVLFISLSYQSSCMPKHCFKYEKEIETVPGSKTWSLLDRYITYMVVT